MWAGFAEEAPARAADHPAARGAPALHQPPALAAPVEPGGAQWLDAAALHAAAHAQPHALRLRALLRRQARPGRLRLAAVGARLPAPRSHQACR